jgi:hypothetical protein
MNRKRQQAFRDRNKDTSEHQMNLNRKRQKIFREQNKKKKQEHNFSYYKKNKGEIYRKRQQAFRERNKDTTELQMNLREQNKKMKQEHNFTMLNDGETRKNCQIFENYPIQDSDTSEFNIFENDNTENMQKIFSRIDMKFCHATTVDDEDTCKPNPDIQRSNICVVCDRLIIGMEEVKKISKKHLILNKQCLSVQQYEDHYSLTLKPDLIGQYQVNDIELKDILLSPRSQSFLSGKYYQCCSSCYNSLVKSKNESDSNNPPKFSIANGFAIGHIPEILRFKTKSGQIKERLVSIEYDFDDIFCAAISPVRPFGYVHAYTGGSQKCITGHFSFFSVDQSHVGGVLNKYQNIKNVAKNIFIVLCGRMTPDQKRIVQRQVSNQFFHYGIFHLFL